ncbi:MAG TPA: hypothetical protein VIH99_12690 [Bdellovibrionota bacterium]|jgi:hypothetical protein
MNALFISLLLLAPNAQAKTFTLDCEWTAQAPRPANDPDYQVVKNVFRDRGGKWKFVYTLVATPENDSLRPQVFQLEEVSGDEGYLVFKAKGTGTEKLGWITIKNEFNWATIDAEDGNYDCH